MVDTEDREVGLMEKMQAHREAKLHRAFSVFLLNDRNELLLQQRALDKYHCGGLWTNTCCSHPRANESLDKAVKRRLQEEMGIEAVTQRIYSFIYKAEVGDNLYEHELDHVFFGRFSGNPAPESAEVVDWKYIGLTDLRRDVEENPHHYTPWFKIILTELNDKQILERVL